MWQFKTFFNNLIYIIGNISKYYCRNMYLFNKYFIIQLSYSIIPHICLLIPKSMNNDVLGTALHDYYFGKRSGKLWILNQYGPKEEMPVAMYFRQYDYMPELEQTALQHCKGTVLDIGAGAGSHALWLQQEGYSVTAID